MLWLGSLSNVIQVADKDQHSNMDDKVEEQEEHCSQNVFRKVTRRGIASASRITLLGYA